jgi:Dna[CI] antecedent, DciA
MPKKSGYDKKKGLGVKHPTQSQSTRTLFASRSPRTIGELLTRGSVTSRIDNQLKSQQSWTRWLRETVPTELSGHIVHAVLKESELVVFADTSAWSVRLRFALAAMDDAIRGRNADITRTQVRVMPPRTP